MPTTPPTSGNPVARLWAEKMDASANCLRVLVHDGSAYPARPSVPAGQVRWIGPTQPTGWLAGDEWINNS